MKSSILSAIDAIAQRRIHNKHTRRAYARRDLKELMDEIGMLVRSNKVQGALEDSFYIPLSDDFGHEIIAVHTRQLLRRREENIPKTRPTQFTYSEPIGAAICQILGFAYRTLRDGDEVDCIRSGLHRKIVQTTENGTLTIAPEKVGQASVDLQNIVASGLYLYSQGKVYKYDAPEIYRDTYVGLLIRSVGQNSIVASRIITSEHRGVRDSEHLGFVIEFGREIVRRTANLKNADGSDILEYAEWFKADPTSASEAEKVRQEINATYNSVPLATKPIAPSDKYFDDLRFPTQPVLTTITNAEKHLGALSNLLFAKNGNYLSFAAISGGTIIDFGIPLGFDSPFYLDFRGALSGAGIKTFLKSLEASKQIALGVGQAGTFAVKSGGAMVFQAPAEQSADWACIFSDFITSHDGVANIDQMVTSLKPIGEGRINIVVDTTTGLLLSDNVKGGQIYITDTNAGAILNVLYILKWSGAQDVKVTYVDGGNASPTLLLSSDQAPLIRVALVLGQDLL